MFSCKNDDKYIAIFPRLQQLLTVKELKRRSNTGACLGGLRGGWWGQRAQPQNSPPPQTKNGFHSNRKKLSLTDFEKLNF